MRNFRNFENQKTSILLSVLGLIDPKKADFEVKTLLNRHLVALGGEKGQNFILTLEHRCVNIDAQ